MAAKRIKDFLETNKVKYVSLYHSAAYTAQEIAASVHVKGREMAKTVMVKIDGSMAMVVVPAFHQVDFEKLKQRAGVSSAELAAEEEFKHLFPDCEIGAMPPFGNLFGMAVFVSTVLAEDAEIAFNACSHMELIRMSFDDYRKLADPRIIDCSVPPGERKKAA